MRPLFTILLFVLFIHRSHAQDYVNYHRINNRADECILRGDFKTAAVKLDSLYHGYTFLYARHCFKALQIACVLNDTPNVHKWLTKCFLQGVPLWMIRINAIATQAQYYPRSQSIINSYDSLYKIYQSRINLPLARTIDKMFIYDQKLTYRVNNGFFLWKLYDYSRWRHNNRKQYRTIQSFIKQYGYPGEKLIGLPEDDGDSAKHYKFYVRRAHTVILRIELQYMMQHCYSNPRKDIRAALLEQVTLGNLEACQYGVYADYMYEYGRQKYGHYERYYEWFRDHATEDTTIINARRDSLGLPSLQLRQKQHALFDSVLKNNVRNRILSDI
jgi:hypothetical protein